MTKNYNQLSLVQRYQIEAFWKAGMKQKFIAEQIGVHPSTVSRELDRNIGKRGRKSGMYEASQAQYRAEKQHREKPKLVKFDHGMKLYISEKLSNEKWSPEYISTKGKETGKCLVSHEWIYRWIWACKHSNKRQLKGFKTLYTLLKHGRRHRKRGNRKDNRGIIPGRISITERPPIVDQRTRLGDYEVDLMIGKDHKSALLVVLDRTTLQTRLKKLRGKNASFVKQAVIQAVKKNPYPAKTITFDNDKAFSLHRDIGKALEADTFFARPYTSQDKGSVENRIGIIRRFFPKKTDLNHISIKDLNQVEKQLNERPVRKFNYKSPNQKLQEKIALIS